MTTDGQVIGESDFKIIDKDELAKMKDESGDIVDELFKQDDKEQISIGKGGNLRDDLIELGFLDYDNLSEEEKKIFDELKNEKRDDFYELD